MSVPLTGCGREEQQAHGSHDRVALPDGMGTPPYDGVPDSDLEANTSDQAESEFSRERRMFLTPTLAASARVIFHDWAKTAFSKAARLSCPSYVPDDRPSVVSDTMRCVATTFQMSAPMCVAVDANSNSVVGRTIVT